MRLILLFLFITPSLAFGLDAVVTVLETPILKFKSFDAPVVQYLRKGDKIRVHPSIANSREMEQYAPSPAKLKKLKAEQSERAEARQDPLFRGEDENTYYIEDQFIPTVDRQGNIAYVISDHIFVYFGDRREFEQRVALKDPTDYRLEEPLPKRYPLLSPTGYRGQFLLGITQPYYESYPYNQSVTTKGYSSPVDATFTLLKQAPGKYDERLFIGGSLSFRTFENSFTFADRRLAEERNYRFGLGPTISYDAFKGDKNRINLSGTIILNLFDRFNISQRDATRRENRVYEGYSVSPRLHLQYHRKQIFPDLDFVLGTSLEMGSATSFRAKNAGKDTTWWRAIGDDKFTTRTTFTLGGYVGIQSAY